MIGVLLRAERSGTNKQTHGITNYRLNQPRGQLSKICSVGNFFLLQNATTESKWGVCLLKCVALGSLCCQKRKKKGSDTNSLDLFANKVCLHCCGSFSHCKTKCSLTSTDTFLSEPNSLFQWTIFKCFRRAGNIFLHKELLVG